MQSKKGRYDFLEHTADIKFRAYGKDLEELFTNSAEAMFSILIRPEVIKKRLKKQFTVQGNTLERLLYDFLEEFLFLMDTEGFMLSEIKDIKIIEKTEDKDNIFILEAICIGDSAENYNFSGDIKSITFHEMKLEQKKDQSLAEVVVDV